MIFSSRLAVCQGSCGLTSGMFRRIYFSWFITNVDVLDFWGHLILSEGFKECRHFVSVDSAKAAWNWRRIAAVTVLHSLCSMRDTRQNFWKNQGKGPAVPGSANNSKTWPWYEKMSKLVAKRHEFTEKYGAIIAGITSGFWPTQYRRTKKLWWDIPMPYFGKTNDQCVGKVNYWK